MKQAALYSLKVWATILLLFPAVVVVTNYNESRTLADFIFNYLWFLPGELIVSIIPIALFLRIVHVMNRKAWVYKRKKVMILVFSELIVLIQCGLYIWYHFPLNDDYTEHVYLSLAAYFCIVALATIPYKLKASYEAHTETSTL